MKDNDISQSPKNKIGKSIFATSVPLVVDSVKAAEEMPLARLTYWVLDLYLLIKELESETDLNSYVLRVISMTLPPPVKPLLRMMDIDAKYGMLPIGFQGILIGTSRTARPEITSELLQELFGKDEEDSHLTIETASVWLPAELLESKPDGPPAPGDLFRVSSELFRTALESKAEDDSAQIHKRLMEKAEEGSIEFSQKETEVLHEWTKNQVGKMRDKYQQMKQERRPLAYRDEEGGGAL